MDEVKGSKKNDYPFPDNINAEYEEFCKGCKLCDVVSSHYTSGKTVYGCKHMLRCMRVYERALTDAENGLRRLNLDIVPKRKNSALNGEEDEVREKSQVSPPENTVQGIKLKDNGQKKEIDAYYDASRELIFISFVTAEWARANGWTWEVVE